MKKNSLSAMDESVSSGSYFLMNTEVASPSASPETSSTKTAPFGSWKSPITSDLIVADSVSLGEVHADGGDVYWVEGRPTEGGRCVLVRLSAEGERTDVTPPAFSVRTRVHEYGGGAVIIHQGVVYFANDGDQKLYRQELGQAPRAISQGALCRYADAVMDTARQRIICVREDHRDPANVINTLVALPEDGMGEEIVLASGHDFYSDPRISPDGQSLVWLTWDHPNMPWTETELWQAEFTAAGELTNVRQIAGGAGESLFQPAWSPEGILHFVSDRNGWWNLWRRVEDQCEPVLPMSAEFGLAQWVFGNATYGFSGDGNLIASYRERGVSHLGVVSADATGAIRFQELSLPYTEIDNLRVSHGKVVLLAGAPDKPLSVARLDIASGAVEVLKKATDLMDDPHMQRYLSAPTHVEFCSGDRTAYAWYYPPHNPDFTAVGELPPLIVRSHGGPTYSASSVLNLKIQYWTSRGYAVLDVDYGGSTGYGRAYRDLLQRQWGVVDLEDCANAARHLAEKKLADRDRVAITGGSAGGYTTLCALTFTDVFKLGASYYGVSDLEALARDTHKFESRYMEWLVGRYPEEREIYQQRSPVHFTDRLSVPVIFFQGSEDAVVPPNQAEMMVEAIRKKGVPVGYFLFEGEQHGFRKAENIKRSLDAELYFYSLLMVRSGLRF